MAGEKPSGGIAVASPVSSQGNADAAPLIRTTLTQETPRVEALSPNSPTPKDRTPGLPGKLKRAAIQRITRFTGKLPWNKDRPIKSDDIPPNTAVSALTNLATVELPTVGQQGQQSVSVEQQSQNPTPSSQAEQQASMQTALVSSGEEASTVSPTETAGGSATTSGTTQPPEAPAETSQPEATPAPAERFSEATRQELSSNFDHIAERDREMRSGDKRYSEVAKSAKSGIDQGAQQRTKDELQGAVEKLGAETSKTPDGTFTTDKFTARLGEINAEADPTKQQQMIEQLAGDVGRYVDNIRRGRDEAQHQRSKFLKTMDGVRQYESSALANSSQESAQTLAVVESTERSPQAAIARFDRNKTSLDQENASLTANEQRSLGEAQHALETIRQMLHKAPEQTTTTSGGKGKAESAGKSDASQLETQETRSHNISEDKRYSSYREQLVDAETKDSSKPTVEQLTDHYKDEVQRLLIDRNLGTHEGRMFLEQVAKQDEGNFGEMLQAKITQVDQQRAEGKDPLLPKPSLDTLPEFAAFKSVYEGALSHDQRDATEKMQTQLASGDSVGAQESAGPQKNMDNRAIGEGIYAMLGSIRQRYSPEDAARIIDDITSGKYSLPLEMGIGIDKFAKRVGRINDRLNKVANTTRVTRADSQETLERDEAKTGQSPSESVQATQEVTTITEDIFNAEEVQAVEEILKSLSTKNVELDTSDRYIKQLIGSAREMAKTIPQAELYQIVARGMRLAKVEGELAPVEAKYAVWDVLKKHQSPEKIDAEIAQQRIALRKIDIPEEEAAQIDARIAQLKEAKEVFTKEGLGALDDTARQGKISEQLSELTAALDPLWDRRELLRADFSAALGDKKFAPYRENAFYRQLVSLPQRLQENMKANPELAQQQAEQLLQIFKEGKKKHLGAFALGILLIAGVAMLTEGMQVTPQLLSQDAAA